MARSRSLWIHLVAAVAGVAAMLFGLARWLRTDDLSGTVLAVLGFLVLGWSVLDARRYRRGTPESEVDGGHTIE